MRQTCRWFGPADSVSIDDMMQASFQSVVTALHHIPTGEVWSPAEIEARQQAIPHIDGTPPGLTSEVVESLTDNLSWRRPNDVRCMRFDLVDFAAFDMHIWPPGAAADLPEALCEAAERRLADSLTMPDLRALLDSYAPVTNTVLREDALIPMRPDHGQDILDDIGRGGQPGYPAIGRQSGLAELRGVEAALARSHGLWP